MGRRLPLISGAGFHDVVARRQLGEEPGTFRFNIQDRPALGVQNINPDCREIFAATLHCKEQAQIELVGQAIEFSPFTFTHPTGYIANALISSGLY